MLGAGVALLRDQRMLANPRVALAQIDARFLRQAHQPLAGCVHQLGVGREGDRLLLHRGVDDDACEVGVPGQLGDLLTRAADVQLKERRRLVLVARESPLHLGHLRAMAQVTEYGAIIAPPVPAFYLKPADIAAIVDQIALRALGLLGLDLDGPAATEWHGVEPGLAGRAGDVR